MAADRALSPDESGAAVRAGAELSGASRLAILEALTAGPNLVKVLTHQVAGELHLMKEALRADVKPNPVFSEGLEFHDFGPIQPESQKRLIAQQNLASLTVVREGDPIGVLESIGEARVLEHDQIREEGRSVGVKSLPRASEASLG